MIADFLAWVDSLAEPELCQYLIELGRKSWAGKVEATDRLMLLYYHRIVPICDCDPVIIPCTRLKCIEQRNHRVCKHSRISWDHCPHAPGEDVYFGWAAHAIVARYVDPDNYCEPDPCDERTEENAVTSHAAKAEVLAARAARGVRLYHPKDMGDKRPGKGNWDEREERIGRKAMHLANGQPVKNVPLKIFDPRGEELPALPWLAADPRTLWLKAHGYISDNDGASCRIRQLRQER